MARSVPVRVQEHFDEIAAAYYGIVDRLWYDVGYYHHRESEVLSRFRKQRIKLAIDAGCGPGRHTATLAHQSARTVAIDISRKMLEAARQDVIRDPNARVDFVQADVRQMPFRSSVSDFILNFEVLEHLPRDGPDASIAFREFRRVLRPRGIVLAEAPLAQHLSWGRLLPLEGTWKEVSPSERETFYERRPLEANHRFDERDIEASMKAAGLRIRRKFYVRVLPARLIERFPFLAGLDRFLEGLPVVRRLAREAIWVVRIRGAGGDPRTQDRPDLCRG